MRAPHLEEPQQQLEQAAGLGWLEAGITQTITSSSKRGPRLHPGMHGLDLRDWLLVDPETFAEHVGEKERALDSDLRRGKVLQASDPSTLGAQEEVRRLIFDHLLLRYPQYYQHLGAARMAISVDSFEREVDAARYTSPLEAAARLVQEDLVLMRRGGSEDRCARVVDVQDHDRDHDRDEYCIAAAAVAFSFSDLAKRVGQQHSMAALHAKVGNFERDLHRPVSRAMAKLQPSAPFWRSNWSFTFTGAMSPTPDRYLLNLEKRQRIFPEAAVTEWDGPDGAVRRIDTHGAGDVLFLKTEYQTLRRLPIHTDYVLFTVRTHLTPLHALRAQPRAAAVLAENVRGAVQLDFRFYKGLDDPRIVERVLGYLDACAAGRVQ